MREKVFKPYEQKQGALLPPYLDDLISEGHISKVLNKVIDGFDASDIIRRYKGGGAPAYHPVMMLKILIYGYMDGIYTSRKLAKAVRENIVYMWLAGGKTPDFRTINNFRLKLKDGIDLIFKQVVEVAMDYGLVGFKKLFVDGTKIEANSNKHKMVWRKNVERMGPKIDEKINGFLEEIDRLNEEEDRIYGDKDFQEVEAEKEIKPEERNKKIQKAIEKINEQMERKKKKLNKELKKALEQKEENEKKKAKLGKRNSYSKTDESASAMKTKDDAIKPCYNLVIGTENQVIVNYEVEQNAGDGRCFRNLMEKGEKLYGQLPEAVCGDSAFGCVENYEYCEEKKMEAFLKYGMYHPEKKKKFKEDKFRKENFAYDEEEDVYICPNGKSLKVEEEKEEITATGYKHVVKVYRCDDCTGCPFKEECTKGSRRSIQINKKLERYKTLARDRLNSPEGIKLRKQRGVDVETPFGDVKHNGKYRRFILRGIKKVKIEAGLLSIAHNLKKIYTVDIEKKMKETALTLSKRLFNSPILKKLQLFLESTQLFSFPSLFSLSASTF